MYGGGLFTRYSNDAGLADRRWDEERQSVSDTRCVRAMRFERCIDPVSHRSMSPPRERCVNDLWCADQTVFLFKCPNINRPFTRSVIRISIRLWIEKNFSPLSLFFSLSFFPPSFLSFSIFSIVGVVISILEFRNRSTLSRSIDLRFLNDRDRTRGEWHETTCSLEERRSRGEIVRSETAREESIVANIRRVKRNGWEVKRGSVTGLRSSRT